MKRRKLVLLVLLSLLMLSAAFILSVLFGPGFSAAESVRALLGHSDELSRSIVLELRLPRALLALSVGGSLALAGLLLQGLFQNPLAEPYTLGLSGGATLGVCLALVIRWTGIAADIAMPLFSFAGAFLAFLVLYFFALRRRDLPPVSILLAGVMISLFSSSLFMLFIALARPEDFTRAMFWTLGSLENPRPYLVWISVGVSAGALAVSLWLGDALNALQLGDEAALHLGIRVRHIRQLIVALCALIVGVSVAVAGVIGFVGLVVPQLTRRFFGSDHRKLLPLSFSAGALFLCLSDVLARTVAPPHELPVGVITGIAGGALLLFELFRSGAKHA